MVAKAKGEFLASECFLPGAALLKSHFLKQASNKITQSRAEQFQFHNVAVGLHNATAHVIHVRTRQKRLRLKHGDDVHTLTESISLQNKVRQWPGSAGLSEVFV